MVTYYKVGPATLSLDNQWKLLRAFASYKKSKGSKSVVLQSLPTMGVQADEFFYSYESIYNAYLKAKEGNKNV